MLTALKPREVMHRISEDNSDGTEKLLRWINELLRPAKPRDCHFV
jgi:hypothetical protein